MTKRRIIDKLRRQFPQHEWHYEFPSRWCSDAGWHVQAYAKFSPRYDGDDEGYVTVWYIETRTDSKEAYWFGDKIEAY